MTSIEDVDEEKTSTSTTTTRRSIDQETKKPTISSMISSSSSSSNVQMETTTKKRIQGELICHGDHIILYANPSNVQSVYLKPKEILNNRTGSFYHDDIVGQRYGSKVYSRTNGKWMYVLKPTPELWTRTLPHRTQIIYSLDSHIICYKLGLKAGSVVVESGTGSGSLSHHFLRCVGSSGHLHTFEFNAHRAETARNEFKRHGIDKHVTVTCCDVCAVGFGEQLNGRVDAVFLDLPSPWSAVSHAERALKPNGNICSFSPCIEQVQRTCEQLRKHHFNRIETVEVLLKTYDVVVAASSNRTNTNDDAHGETTKRRRLTRPRAAMRGHTSYLTFARKAPRTRVEGEKEEE